VPEYDFNLNLAERIRQEMVGDGLRSASVVVTQTGGEAGLVERAERANRMNADIYLSIHHDGVSDGFLKPWQNEGQQHYYYDDASGFSLHVSTKYPESLRLARLLADRLLASGLHFTTVHVPGNPAGARKPFLDSTRGIYRRDDLAVLEFTDMPAVLLEAGMIVNRDEELLVSTPAYQATLAMAAAAAVKKFCNVPEPPTQQNPPTQPAGVAAPLPRR
jgi:N-acetylmuramoyl-L-alanine amidase